MKKVISIILFALTILMALALIAGVIFGINDLYQGYIQITASPGYSGADLLGGIIGTIAIAFYAFVGSAVLLVLSLINVRITENRFIEVFSSIAAMVTGMVCLFSLFGLFGVVIL